MNRHRSNWSQMHDEQREQSQQSKDYAEMRENLQRMVNQFGWDDVATELRRIYERNMERH